MLCAAIYNGPPTNPLQDAIPRSLLRAQAMFFFRVIPRSLLRGSVFVK
jgi:hypothetical protein